ncbi:hypothetical protein D3C81_728960 [compost metagenome]
MGQLLLGDGPAGGEGLASIEVFLGLAQLGLTRRHLGFHAVDIAVQAAHLAYGAGQLGFGGLQADLGIAGVEFEQHLAFVDQVAIVSADADYGAGNQRSDFHHVAVYIGIVGLFAPAPVELVPGPDRAASDDDQQRKGQQPGLALALVVEVLRGVIRRRSSGHC